MGHIREKKYLAERQIFNLKEETNPTIKKSKIMDLNILVEQFAQMQKLLIDAVEVNKTKQLPAAFVVDQEKIAPRLKTMGLLFTKAEAERFYKVQAAYRERFKSSGANKTQVFRAILLYFCKNWESMPMEDIWAEEKELRVYRLKHKALNAPKKRMRKSVTNG